MIKLLLLLIPVIFLSYSCSINTDTAKPVKPHFRSDCNGDVSKDCKPSKGENLFTSIFKENSPPIESNEDEFNNNLCNVLDENNFSEVKNKIINPSQINDVTFKSLTVSDTGSGKIKKLVLESNTSSNEATKPKTIDILYDLTYFSSNDVTENDLRLSRKQKLRNYLSSIYINEGDVVNLKYIGTSDYGDKPENENIVIKDTDKFFISNDELITHTLTFRCKKSNFNNTLTLFYDYKKDGNVNISDISKKRQELIDNILAKIDTMYDQKRFNAGTFLIESVHNYGDFLNSEDSNITSIIVSDFRFQLHPTMRINKSIAKDSPESVFPPLNLEEISNSSTQYSKLYKEELPKYLEDKCPKNNSLILVGLELDDNLDRQKVMRDYFKNILFKKCNVTINL